MFVHWYSLRISLVVTTVTKFVTTVTKIVTTVTKIVTTVNSVCPLKNGIESCPVAFEIFVWEGERGLLVA